MAETLELTRKLPPYETFQAEGYAILKLAGALSVEGLKEFESKELPKLSSQPGHLIINCEEVTGIAKQWFRALMTLNKEVTKGKRSVRLILVPPDVVQMIKDEGLHQSLKSMPTLRDALIDLGLATKKSFDVGFINPFLDATIKVLRVQTRTEAKPGQISVKKEQDRFSGDISGIIGLLSDSFKGAIVISFPQETYFKIMSRMLKQEYTEMKKEIESGAAEIANIILGQAKTILNEKGYGLKPTLPTVVHGKDHKVSILGKGPVVVVPFESDAGPLFVEICLS